MLAPTESRRVRFGSYELDSATGELRKDGRRVKLQPQPVRVLELLVSRAGELVTRDELQLALWPEGTSVEFDQGLNFCIRQIRVALGESASDPTYLETLPKRGYRFIAPIVPVEAAATPKIAVEAPPVTRVSAGRRFGLIFAGLAATLLIAAYWMYARGDEAPRTILVRPFQGMGLPAENVWYPDSLTAQLIGALSRTKQVRVLPWSTSVAVKDQVANIQELGRRFEVDTIIEGSVQQKGNGVRVTVAVVDVNSKRQLWQESIDQEAADFARIENDFMRSIVDTLQFRMRETNTPTARRPPEDRETYTLYLKATAAKMNGRSPKASADALEKVIQSAPEFAPAYAGLANIWAYLPVLRPGPRKDTVRKAAEYARKAIDLDPELADGHTALAHALLYLRRWKEAESEFRHALRLDPDSAETHQLFAIYLAIQGRFDEAINRAEKAARLAPTSSLMDYTVSLVHFHAGNFDQAIAASRRTLEFDPHSAGSYHFILRSYALKGMHREAMAALTELEKVTQSPHELWRAYLLARSGDHAAARTKLRQWDASHPEGGYNFQYALAQVECGEIDSGFEMLRTVSPTSEGVKIWSKQTPELRKWRGDPRYQAVIEAVDRQPEE